jgi:hypothetical protein
MAVLQTLPFPLLRTKRYLSLCCAPNATFPSAAHQTLPFPLLRTKRYLSLRCTPNATFPSAAHQTLPFLLLRTKRYLSLCCAPNATFPSAAHQTVRLPSAYPLHSTASCRNGLHRKDERALFPCYKVIVSHYFTAPLSSRIKGVPIGLTSHVLHDQPIPFT